MKAIALGVLACLFQARASLAAPTALNSTTRYAGVNIAGFDFGCSTDGTCTQGTSSGPLDVVTESNALGQMRHFVNDDKLNAFRLPVGWQFLVGGSQPGGRLNATDFAKYDALVQDCLRAGAQLCIIDIHNYARWDGQIVGQGGPTDAQFASLWGQLAAEYKESPKVAFGIMNEPHDIPDIDAWAASVQTAVTAIRTAGAHENLVLLPGNDYTSAAKFVANGSGAALLKVKNLDGGTRGLIFDVHKYLDSDNSGTSTECVTDNVDDAFKPLAQWLRENGRKAFNSETGGGNTASCEKYLCQQIQFVNANADVYLGYTGWAAGGFDSSYELSETPTQSGGNWTDKALVSKCISRA